MKLFSVAIGCYGNYPQYSVRAVRSVIETSALSGEFELHVGLNQCCRETVSYVREQIDVGRVDSVIECRANINKDPMLRLMIERVQTPYLLWMDDDSHVLPGWDEALLAFIQEHQPFEAAGHVFFCHRSPEYLEFLHQRPWWKGEEQYREAGHRDVVWFATGGFFLVNVAFLREVNFPDRAMIKKQDDLLLGDCISQNRGRLIDFSRHQNLMDCIRISDGNRRGEGEGDDGWRRVHSRLGV
jgi:hypothetical protein